MIIIPSSFHNPGETFIEMASSVLGTGVFNSDGEMWKFHRTMTRPFFVRDRISHFDIFARHADALISKVKLAQASFDAQDLFARFTIDAATEFLFGREHCVGALELEASLDKAGIMHDEKDSRVASNAFAAAFAEAQDVMTLRLRLGDIWPLWEIWRDRSKGPMDIVYAYVDPIIEAALRKKHDSLVMGRSPDEKVAEVGDPEHDESLLDNLVSKIEGPSVSVVIFERNYRYKPDLHIDMSVLRDELINIMLAGRDTVSSNLSLTYDNSRIQLYTCRPLQP